VSLENRFKSLLADKIELFGTFGTLLFRGGMITIPVPHGVLKKIPTTFLKF
jgi:hypothetical protein